MVTFKDILENIGTDIDPDDLDRDIFDDIDLFENMLDFVLELDVESLNDDQVAQLESVVSQIEKYVDDADDSSDDLDEAVPARRVRRDLKKKREGARARRRKKIQLKLKARKFRKSAKGKQLAKRQKRMSKLGKTSTGKRKRKFIN